MQRVHFTEFDLRLAAYAVIVDDADRILLTWYNGEGRGDPCWSLPGGGVEFDESIEDAVVREVLEETGYHVRLGPPLTTHSWWTTDAGPGRRPYKSARVLFTATITGGELGTLEVGGTTDRADWVPIAEVAGTEHADIVTVGIEAVRALL